SRSGMASRTGPDVASFDEVNVPALHVDRGKLHPHTVADVKSMFAPDESSLNRRRPDPHVGSLRRGTGHDGVEPFADARFDDERGGRFSHLAFHFVRRI